MQSNLFNKPHAGFWLLKLVIKGSIIVLFPTGTGAIVWKLTSSFLLHVKTTKMTPDRLETYWKKMQATIFIISERKRPPYYRLSRIYKGERTCQI